MRLVVPFIAVGTCRGIALRITLGIALASSAVLGCSKLGGSSGSGGEAPSASASRPVATVAASAGAARASASSPSPAHPTLRTVASSAPVVGDAVKGKCDLKASEVKGEKNTARIVECPSGCTSGSVWGTDLYTDDSAVCAALVHAGVLQPAGGKAAITFVAGQTTYLGSARNGVGSSSYGKWGRSFYGQPLDAAGKPTGPAPVPLDDSTARLACTDSALELAGVNGTAWHVICPSDCGTSEGSVWGSSPFTADSSVCRAAVFSGLVKGDEVDVKLTFGGKQPSFKAGTANGVTTNDFGPYEKTYTLSKN